MEKEFVSYEKAVALKELGFDEPCLGSYETAFSRGVDFQLGYIISGPKNYVLTPLKQQVFRWFREKYNFDIPYIQKLRKLGVVFYYCQVPNTDISFRATSYEEAENACIDKLIEIAKQKEI